MMNRTMLSASLVFALIPAALARPSGQAALEKPQAAEKERHIKLKGSPIFGTWGDTAPRTAAR